MWPLTQLLKPLEVPRSHVASKNPILYDHGSGVNEFFQRGTEYFGRQVVPPDNKFSDGTPSFMAPGSHYHLLQTETFHVESGEGIWYLGDRVITLKAGDDITIPRFIGHRFENMPGSTKPLSILYRYDAQRYDMERRFFCNALTYLDDCRLAGTAPSVPQLCVFLSDCWMPGQILWVPGGEYVRCLINTIFMFFMGAIGRWLFGYKESYSEYHTSEANLPPGYFSKQSKKDV
ncbi:hypothetical protein N0V93_009296 [Gnomoniopsis smithogilvyi]|uniref:Cupin type-2 domain-containing protein n=1 Tax=Gnomoniopsis smithogilvyi TaxID=1191159 RepID=A0A9W8YKU2_9PEZI|nr:hypothetical protein N0V93_009296 [Gnomoniopsis smithogilvyi]